MFSRSVLLPCKLSLTRALFLIEPLLSRFEAPACAFRAGLFVSQLLNPTLCDAKVRSQRDVARTNEIAAATFDAVDEAVLAQFRFIVGARVPKQLLR